MAISQMVAHGSRECTFLMERLFRVEFPVRFTELFKLADYNGEEDLKQRCWQQLKLLTTKDNVCDLYSIAVQYNGEVTF